jgi:methionine salvage enolase-phosphatase E1
MNKVYLIDIDGTVCDDIKNEDAHLYPTAKHFQDALETLNGWYEQGDIITFFTAREEKDREVTEEWLVRNGFKFHGLIMGKPRIKDGQAYHWIDNRPVKATRYLDKFTELTRKKVEIEVFKEEENQ